MITPDLECIVVGGGVIGLAVARALAGRGQEVVVLEAEPAVGMHASSRNSEVIHAGIYYGPGSLKARLCVAGKKAIYAYCDARGIPHRRIGKLIVATREADLPKLESLRALAARNGVNDLGILSAEQVRDLEPHVACRGALLSPSTGILDSHALLLALQGDIGSQGGQIVLNSRVTAVARLGGGFRLTISGEDVTCRRLVNAAGLWAQQLARSLSGTGESAASRPAREPESDPPERFLAKGHYFRYADASAFGRLIYPLPAGGGLGIHATPDTGGALRFGPDVSWVDDVDYAFDEKRKPLFEAAIREYFPGLDSEKLTPDFTGIRPKLNGPDETAADFVIATRADHGTSGLVNLFGIESPGLTASLGIAEYVARALLEE